MLSIFLIANMNITSNPQPEAAAADMYGDRPVLSSMLEKSISLLVARTWRMAKSLLVIPLSTRLWNDGIGWSACSKFLNIKYTCNGVLWVTSATVSREGSLCIMICINSAVACGLQHKIWRGVIPMASVTVRVWSFCWMRVDRLSGDDDDDVL